MYNIIVNYKTRILECLKEKNFMKIEMGFSYPKEVEQIKSECKPVFLPVGTMEYHSHHCPFGCDTLTALGVAERVADIVGGMVLPPVWYGVASYAVGGPDKNTINVDVDTMENYVYCILKSLFESGFKKNIFI
jgi:creatinine amidohydrolase/Fe(II)-dependent formamide hydrolase-like protein